MFIEDIRDGTINGKVRPADWNAIPDELSPAEAESRVKQVLQRGAITRQQLSLYNYGTVGHELFERDSSGALDPMMVHNFSPDDGSTLSRQNNPLRVEVENPAAEDFDVFVSDRQATIRGQFTPEDRPGSHEQFDVALDGTTWVPILSLRIKDDFDEVQVELLSFQGFVSANAAVQIRSNAGSDDTADYSPPNNTDPTETAIEVDEEPTTPTITDGFKRSTRLLPGSAGTGNAAAPLAQIESVDLTLKGGRPVTVFVRLVEGTGGTLEAGNTLWTETW